MDHIGSIGGIYGGYQVIQSNFMSERVQFRRPTSKGKRIQRKWAKNQLNWRALPDIKRVMIDHINHRIYCHPITAERIRNELSRR